MIVNLIIKGIASGFSLASPGGSISFLCIKETSLKGINFGLISGFGAATADMLYGIVAAIILKIGDNIIDYYESPLAIVGGIFFCYMGIQRLFATSSLDKVTTIPGKPLHIFFSTLLLTLGDTSTILEFIALFIAFDVDIAEFKDSICFVGGVFVGALIWWCLVCFFDALCKKTISMRLLRFINYVTSIIIFLFGIYTLYKLWSSFFR